MVCVPASAYPRAGKYAGLLYPPLFLFLSLSLSNCLPLWVHDRQITHLEQSVSRIFTPRLPLFITLSMPPCCVYLRICITTCVSFLYFCNICAAGSTCLKYTFSALSTSLPEPLFSLRFACNTLSLSISFQ